MRASSKSRLFQKGDQGRLTGQDRTYARESENRRVRQFVVKTAMLECAKIGEAT